jgi:FkbM family methyltransferase
MEDLMLLFMGLPTATRKRLANALLHPMPRLRGRLSPLYMGRRMGLQGRPDIVRLGTDYGGWRVPADLLGPGAICYCAGAGEDISFDLGLIARFGCHVWCFDPTPRSVAYVQRAAGDESRLHFQPLGLWSERSVQRFYSPADPAHVSHSIVNLRGTEAYFEAECDRLSSIMQANGHDRLDLLKLDIEGAEYAVLDTLAEDGVFPSILAVEFDQPVPLSRVAGAVRRIKSWGYELVAIDRWNYTFVYREPAAAKAAA